MTETFKPGEILYWAAWDPINRGLCEFLKQTETNKSQVQILNCSFNHGTFGYPYTSRLRRLPYLDVGQDPMWDGK